MKSLNVFHATVCRWLSELGITYVEEFPVEPYSIDIYSAELNLGIEIDGGMWHNKKRDEKRDKRILVEHGIPIVRIKVGTQKAKALEIILGQSE